MVEKADFFLGTEVFALCKTKPRTIEEMTKKIYGNNYAKNVVRVYQVMVVFMKRGLLVPCFKDRVLTFKINNNGDE